MIIHSRANGLSIGSAIPAAFGYNYLLQQSRTAIVELENFASVVADRIEMEAQAAAAGFL